MREEHFDLFPELHRNHVFISFGQISGNLAGFFMFFTGDRSGVRIGTALRFEWANLAGQFQSTILCGALARRSPVWIGIITAELLERVAALLGPNAAGLSSTTISRLKADWWDDYERWQRRELSARRIVYIWADGVYFQPRMEEKQCVLVLIGADEWGGKEILGPTDGYRESTQSWRELLLDLKRRGLAHAPDLAIGDGGLGFWAALREVFGATTEQRCWFHKTGNVLNVMPKSVQAKAKGHLHDIWQAETKAEAKAAFDFFVETYGVKYEKAVAKLIKDREALLAFYDFSAEHWKPIRTTNPIESTFATVRHRAGKTKGCLSRKTGLAMAYKLMMSAQGTWRKLDGSNRMPEIIQGIAFVPSRQIASQSPAGQWTGSNNFNQPPDHAVTNFRA